MALSLQTSELMAARIENDLAEKHIEQLIKAINAKKFSDFAKMVIKESNQLHAICQDTYPTICYMNEYSRQVISLCTKLNREAANNEEMVAYSVDAGSHVFVFTMKDNIEFVMAQLNTLNTDDNTIFERII